MYRSRASSPRRMNASPTRSRISSVGASRRARTRGSKAVLPIRQNAGATCRQSTGEESSVSSRTMASTAAAPPPARASAAPARRSARRRSRTVSARMNPPPNGSVSDALEDAVPAQAMRPVCGSTDSNCGAGTPRRAGRRCSAGPGGRRVRRPVRGPARPRRGGGAYVPRRGVDAGLLPARTPRCPTAALPDSGLSRWIASARGTRWPYWTASRIRQAVPGSDSVPSSHRSSGAGCRGSQWRAPGERPGKRPVSAAGPSATDQRRDASPKCAMEAATLRSAVSNRAATVSIRAVSGACSPAYNRASGRCAPSGGAVVRSAKNPPTEAAADPSIACAPSRQFRSSAPLHAAPLRRSP